MHYEGAASPHTPAPVLATCQPKLWQRPEHDWQHIGAAKWLSFCVRMVAIYLILIPLHPIRHPIGWYLCCIPKNVHLDAIECRPGGGLCRKQTTFFAQYYGEKIILDIQTHWEVTAACVRTKCFQETHNILYTLGCVVEKENSPASLENNSS